MMVEKSLEEAKADKERMQAEQERRTAERYAERMARLGLEYAATNPMLHYPRCPPPTPSCLQGQYTAGGRVHTPSGVALPVGRHQLPQRSTTYLPPPPTFTRAYDGHFTHTTTNRRTNCRPIWLACGML
jgi:hypothetical protein